MDYARKFDPISEDPEPVSSAYPAMLEAVTIESCGDKLLGVLLLAQGRGPHPTLVLLHGLPGSERNFDLAHTFRRAGWNVLVFHYRGSWGSQGIFSFSHVLEDVFAACRFLTSTGNREVYRIDGGRIVLVGHSLGGFAALMTQASNKGIVSAASIAGFNLGLLARALRENRAPMEPLIKYYEEQLPPLRIPSARSLFEELLRFGEKWDLVNQVEKLARSSLLLIAGNRDQDAPARLHHDPLVRALQACNAGNVNEIILDADHYFSGKRVALARAILSWLDTLPR
jgi:dipeptidyl aminopeptidase/acylaminoacyl peptidase